MGDAANMLILETTRGEVRIAMRPDLEVMFMTGFTKNAIVHNGVLDPGVHFLAKPFSLEELSKKLREVLEEAG